MNNSQEALGFKIDPGYLNAVYKEKEWAEFERFEDIITLSESEMKEAIATFMTLSKLDKEYMAQRHIDYTNKPRQLYKFTLHALNLTF